MRTGPISAIQRFKKVFETLHRSLSFYLSGRNTLNTSSLSTAADDAETVRYFNASHLYLLLSIKEDHYYGPLCVDPSGHGAMAQ